jgi:hypothetical protein
MTKGMRLFAVGLTCLLPVTTWLLLRDLPPTSHGGYWHYFWPTWLFPVMAWIVMEARHSNN